MQLCGSLQLNRLVIPLAAGAAAVCFWKIRQRGGNRRRRSMFSFENFKRACLVLAAVLFLAFVCAAVADADEPVNPAYTPDTNVDGTIQLSELLRVVQFFNQGGYHACPGEGTEDGFCPGPAPVPVTIDLAIGGFTFVSEALDDPTMDHLVVEVTANELPATHFFLGFYLDGQLISTEEVLPNSQSWLFGARIAESLLTPGNHVASIVVDLSNQILETNENNNRATVNFNIPSPLLTVPDLTGMAWNAAFIAIEEAGLIRHDWSFVCNDEATYGRVTEQNPVPGTEVVAGTLVDLVLSSGPCESEGEVEGTVEGEPEGTTEGSVEGETEGSVEGQEEGENPCLDPIGLAVVVNSAQVVAGESAEVSVSFNRGTCLVAGINMAIPLPNGSVVSEYMLTEGFSNPNVNVSEDSVLLVSASSAEAVTMSGEFFTFVVAVPETAEVGAFDLGFIIDDTNFYAVSGTEVGISFNAGVLEVLPPATEEGEGQVEPTLPDFSGMTQSAARALAESLGLTCDSGTLTCSDTVTAGHVMGQEPAAGSLLDGVSEVLLTISTGSCGETYTIETEVLDGVGGTVEVSPAGPYVVGTEVTLTAIPDEGWVLDSWYTPQHNGNVNPLTYVVLEDTVISVRFREAGVAVPTLTFECPTAEGRIPVKVEFPYAHQIKEYLVNRYIGNIAYIGVAGPHGNWVWDPSTSPSNPDVVAYTNTYTTELSTSFEPWSPGHFSGNLFVVDTAGTMTWFDLTKWTASFGDNDDVIGPDEAGTGLIVEFLANSGGCD